MEYVITGELRAGREGTPFERTLDAESEEHARELVRSQLGSEHSIDRSKIRIESVNEA